ncbi:MAG: C1 family peptidase [Bacteroidales bacterium]
MKKIIHLLRGISLLMVATFTGLTGSSQVHPDFNLTKSVKTTSVKNQGRTGTCWCFATISFIETEAIRKGKPSLDLSEMFIVKHAYTDKAQKYVRYQGKANFGEGGQGHDVFNEMKKFGLVTEEAYSGLAKDATVHNHAELSKVLEGLLTSMLATERAKPSPFWLPSFNAVVENYLGTEPKEFKYQGKSYDPVKFAKEVVGVNPSDYIELTSYKIYPYYQKSDLEIPDNWSHDLYYNIPLNDLMTIFDNALNNGYSVLWDGDVSEADFSHDGGTAVLSLKETDGIILSGVEEMRQSTFDDFSTTDDHLMHITGLAKDKDGSIFYLTKNSWGENSNPYGGYLYMSKWYVQLKTIAITVHKDAIPVDLKKKMGI